MQLADAPNASDLLGYSREDAQTYIDITLGGVTETDHSIYVLCVSGGERVNVEILIMQPKGYVS